MKTQLDKVVKCESKSRLEANKRNLGTTFYNPKECEDCSGYNIECIKYHPTPKWFGKD